MLSHHDTACSSASRDERHCPAEGLLVATFLKPRFRIGVAPISGQLEVHVEVRPAEARKVPCARH